MPDLIPPFKTERVNRQIVLIRRPQGSPLAADFARVDGEIATPGEGQFLVRNLYLAGDPVLGAPQLRKSANLPSVRVMSSTAF